MSDSSAFAPQVQVNLCTPVDREEPARLFNACFEKKVDVAGSRGTTTAIPMAPR